MLPFAALRNHIYQMVRTLLRCKTLPADLLCAQVPHDEHLEVLALLERKGLLYWAGPEVALTPRGIELARACERWRVDRIAEWHKSRRVEPIQLRTIRVSARPENPLAAKGGTLSLPMLKP